MGGSFRGESERFNWTWAYGAWGAGGPGVLILLPAHGTGTEAMKHPTWHWAAIVVEKPKVNPAIALPSILKKAANTELTGTAAQVFHRSQESSFWIQAADYCAWGTFRK